MTKWPELDITPGPVIRVFGLKRSGNHAIINWLTRNAPEGRSIFFNNCRAGKSPFVAHHGIELNGEHVRRTGARVKRYARQAGDGAAVFISYENVMPHGDRKRPIAPELDEDKITQNVVIARDFLNWSASMVKKVQGNASIEAHQRLASVLRMIPVYGQMLDLMIAQPDNGLVVITYADWHSDPGFRHGILNALGFEPRDDNTSRVEAYGSGSSFQPEATDASQLRPLDRWQEMKDDPEYKLTLWLAAQDHGFVEKLGMVFPDAIGPLRDMTAETPYRG